MYDAAIGRWMNTDPYGQYHSPYLAMGNNPVSSVDPDGGYSWFGAKWRQIGSFIRGENPGKIYHNGSTYGFNTGPGGEAGAVWHFADSKPLKIQSQIDDAYYLLWYKEMGLPMHNGRPKASGKADVNYFFEEMAITGAIGRGAGLFLGRAQVAEGIYEFTAVSGRTYVGQSGNIAARLEQHIASGKLLSGTPVKTTEVLGGKTAREIAEQLRIDALGGIHQNGVKVLENIRNPIGTLRKDLLLPYQK